MKEELSQAIGRNLIMVGLAIGTSVLMYIVQIESIDIRLQQVEQQAHPPDDYRKLLEEQIQNLKDDLKQHNHRGN